MNSVFRCTLFSALCGLVWPLGVAADCASEAPKLISQVSPEYPPLALKRRIQGDVTLELAVNVEGRLMDVRVVGKTKKLLDDAALTAVKQWGYSPSHNQEKNRIYGFWIKISFSLQDKTVKITELTEPPAIAFVESDELQPKLIKRVEPIFPPELFVPQLEAPYFSAALQINSAGDVVCVHTLRTSSSVLNEPATNAFKQWHYQMPDRYKISPFPLYKYVKIRFEVR